MVSIGLRDQIHFFKILKKIEHAARGVQCCVNGSLLCKRLGPGSLMKQDPAQIVYEPSHIHLHLELRDRLNELELWLRCQRLPETHNLIVRRGELFWHSAVTLHAARTAPKQNLCLIETLDQKSRQEVASAHKLSIHVRKLLFHFFCFLKSFTDLGGHSAMGKAAKSIAAIIALHQERFFGTP